MSAVNQFFERARPLGWLHLLLLPAAGWLLAGGGAWWRLPASVAAAAWLLVAGQAYETRRAEGGKTSGGGVTFTAVIALLLVFPLGWCAGVGALIFAAAQVLRWGPARLEKVPFAGLGLESVGVAAVGLLGATSFNRAALSLVGMAALWAASVRLIEEAAATGGAMERRRTWATATVLGVMVSRRVSFALLLLAAPVARGISPVAAVALVLYALAVGLLWRAGLQPTHQGKAMRWLGLGWALLVGADLLSRIPWP